MVNPYVRVSIHFLRSVLRQTVGWYLDMTIPASDSLVQYQTLYPMLLVTLENKIQRFIQFLP